MIFDEPKPFAEAIESRAVRQLLPTDFRTELLSRIPAELRERAMFSAGVTNVEFLQRASDAIDGMLDGTLDRATARAGLKKVLQRLNYQPVEGEEGSLTDLGSDRRLNLILDHNLRMAQGYGDFMQAQSDEVRFQFPCSELIDTNPGQTENRRDWAAKWAAAGGQFYAGRMIARRDDPIWAAISEFGVPYGPLAFGTYHTREDVSRDECIELGVIGANDEVREQSRDLNTDLQASPEVRDAALKDALMEAVPFGRFIGGVFKFIGEHAA